MARKKLTKAALDFIIEKRNDWHVNYTFADIAKLLKEDFGITITEQAVSKSYRKHKNNQEFQSMPISPTNKETDRNVGTSDIATKKNHDRKARVYNKGKNESELHVAKKKIRDFDEDAGKGINIDHLL